MSNLIWYWPLVGIRFAPAVTDMNDNAPVFPSPIYACKVSEAATRGQLVTMLAATDEDERPGPTQLKYAIVGGNDLQAFKMEQDTGEYLTHWFP